MTVGWKDSTGRTLPPRRFDPFDLVVLSTTFAWSAALNLAKALDSLDDQVRAHANLRRNRRDLTAAVRDTLDQL